MATTQIAQQTALKIQKIAVLTDFSKNADAALHYAAAFARVHKASIVLAHAYLPPACACAAPEIALVYQAFEDFRGSLENRLLKQTEAVYLLDVECTILLREGEPRALLEDLNGADLIVVGTSGQTGLGRAALGSTAEAVFRSSDVPVLTVGPHCRFDEAAPAFDTVLYATDLSSNSTTTLPYALLIAIEHDSELIILHVLRDKDDAFSFDRAMRSEVPLEKMRELVPDTIDLRCKPKYLIGFGSPDEVILQEARNHKAKLIVLGARRGGSFASLARRFGAGTAYRVVAYADCPVLTVRHA